MADRTTPARRVQPIFDVDMGELVEGYQFDGRARSIALWREKKEAQEFEVLCRKLSVRKSRIKWRAKNRVAEREAQSARKRQARRDALRGVVVTCDAPGCTAQWCPLPKRGKARMFCSPECKRRALTKRKGTHTCSLCGLNGHNKRTCFAKETSR